jgi:hypothetical protein
MAAERQKKPASWHGCPNAAGAAREDVPCDTGYEKAKKREFDQCVKSVYYTP